MSDPAATATDAPIAGPGTSLGQARGLLPRGLPGDDTPASPVERVEIHLEDRSPWVRFLLKGGKSEDVAWVGPVDAATLPAGSYQIRIGSGQWVMHWNGPAQRTPVQPIEFKESRLPLSLIRSKEATTGVVPAQVVRPQPPAQAAAPASASAQGSDASRGLAFPVQPDPTALARSQELRDFTWQLLQHFFDAPAIRDRRITAADIDGFAASKRAVAEAVGRVTQAWAEMQRTSTPTLPRFKPMAELIVEQYVFGNETIVLNMLAIRETPLGLGLYHRANALKYYDDHGLPTPDVLGANRRDVYYGSQPRLTFRYAPATSDWATLKLLQTLGGDAEAIAVIEGYWANADLFARHTQAPELDKIFRSMNQQTGMILLFLAAEGVLVLLEKLGSPREKLAAKLLHVGLVWTGRLFLIRFVYGLKETLFEIGHHLYRVKRLPDGTVDDLSRDHLDRASEIARPLLEEIAGLALAAGALKVATATAPFLNPPGGPTSLMFVPAAVGSGVRGGTAAAPAPGAAGVAPPPDFLVVTGTGARPASGEGGKEGDEKPKTPRELEDELLGKDQPPDTPFYFNRRNTSLRVILRELLAHITNPKNQEYYKPAGKPPIRVDPTKVDMRTLDFLKQAPYKELLARYWDLFTKAHSDFLRLQNKVKVDQKTEKEVEARYREIERFGYGNLGDKRPDAVQFFIDRNEFATTDPSFVWWTEFHNLKHEVYVAAIKAATGMEGAGLEIETVQKSRLIEDVPAPDKPAAEAPPTKEE